jgi:hypothetical protein
MVVKVKILTLTKIKIAALIDIGNTLVSLGNQMKSFLDAEVDFQEIKDEPVSKNNLLPRMNKKETEFEDR